jgi:hypothetical protein
MQETCSKVANLDNQTVLELITVANNRVKRSVDVTNEMNVLSV